jgi:hypothetical protein
VSHNGWSNCFAAQRSSRSTLRFAYWPKGTALGVPKQLSRDSVGGGQLDTRGYSRGQKPSVSMLAALVRGVSYLLWRLIDELAPAP